MLDRFRERTATGLRALLDHFGAVGVIALAVVALVSLWVAYLLCGAAGVVGGLLLLAVWPSLFARALEPEPGDDTEYGASFDAMEPRDREILRGIHDKASEFERINRARDLWNLMRRPGDRSRPSVEL